MNEQLIKSTSSEFPPYVEFKDLPDTTTPVDATNLNALQSLMRQDIQDNQSIPTGGVTGQVLGKASNTDYDVEWIYQAGTNYDSLPVGAILPYGSLTPPTGYLVCDGSAVSRTEYANLFSVIGTSFGEGDGTTTFNLPNIDGRGIVGFSSSDDDFNTIGKTGGSKTHTQTVDELARHGHSRSVAHGAGVQAVTIASGNTTDAGDVADFDAIKDTGNSQPMDIMNPYIVACYIIKAYGTAILTGNIVDSLDGNSTTLAPSQRVVKETIGDLEQLNTTDKSSLVNSINEVSYNLVTNGSAVKTGRKIDGKDEYVKRYKINIVTGTINGNVALGFNLASVTVSEMKGYIVYNNGNIYNLDTNNYRYPDDYTYMYLNSQESDIRIFCATPEHYTHAVIDVYYTYN